MWEKGEVWHDCMHLCTHHGLPKESALLQLRRGPKGRPKPTGCCRRSRLPKHTAAGWRRWLERLPKQGLPRCWLHRGAAKRVGGWLTKYAAACSRLCRGSEGGLPCCCCPPSPSTKPCGLTKQCPPSRRWGSRHCCTHTEACVCGLRHACEAATPFKLRQPWVVLLDGGSP